jgi:hypothetical protein
LSTSKAISTDFDAWLAGVWRGGPFTALIVLVRVAEPRIEPLRSTFVHVIGDELDWGDITMMFRSAGVGWDAAAFFGTRAESGGPVPDDVARSRLRQIEERLRTDKLLLNDAGFFDVWGRELRVDEVGSA